MGKFLDKTGLATFWTKCKDTFVKKSELKTINGESIIGTGDITISGGDVDFYKGGYLYAYGMYDKNESGAAIGFNDCQEPTLLNPSGRYICIATDSLDGNYLNYEFPERSGTVLLNELDNNEGISFVSTNNGFFNAEGYPGIATDDGSIYISTGGQMNVGQGYWIYFPDKSGTLATLDDIKYQHDIYIMPGNSTYNTAGIYIYLTLNINQSTAFTKVSEIVTALYNRGNISRYYAVQATGRYGTSSSSFSGFVVSVWADSATKLGILYINSSGTFGTASIPAANFTNGPYDKVN